MSGARKIWVMLALVVTLGLLGVGAATRWNNHASLDSDIPIVTVARGDLTPRIYATGELRATHTAMLSAPQIGGGSLQITHLARTGTLVKKGDVVVEFDPSEQQFKLEQNRSELEQADQGIIKSKADAAVQAANDKVALLKARFDVRRAELEVGRNELVSTIEAKKNDLALEQAKRALAQLEQDVQSHAVSGRATLEVAEEKRHKAQLAMDQAGDNIKRMTQRAPINGAVAIEKNMSTEFFFDGMSLADYHEGDQTNPGATIARIIDPSDMELVARLHERERNNVKVGQAVEIELDALPGVKFSGTVKTIGTMAMGNFWENEQGGHFEVSIQLPKSDARLRSGLTAQVVIAGDVRKDALTVPRQAVFMSNGKHVVYVKNGMGFEAREVKVVAETESRTAIEGLSAGTDILFVNPTESKKSGPPDVAEPMVAGGR